MPDKITYLKAAMLAALLGALAGCQSGETAGGPLRAQFDSTSATQTLQRINERALACWINSGDRAFASYALVPELDTRAGDPRILLVQRGKAQGLPALVISASGNPVSLTTFGPLAQSRLSARINGDIVAWSNGARGCSARA